MKKIRTLLAVSLLLVLSFACSDDSFNDMKVQKIEETNSPANDGDSGSGTGTNPPPGG
jgi:hypothetical protein